MTHGCISISIKSLQYHGTDETLVSLVQALVFYENTFNSNNRHIGHFKRNNSIIFRQKSGSCRRTDGRIMKTTKIITIDNNTVQHYVPYKFMYQRS